MPLTLNKVDRGKFRFYNCGQYEVAPVVASVRDGRPVPKAGTHYHIWDYDEAVDFACDMSMANNESPWGVFCGMRAIEIVGNWDGDFPEPITD